MSRVILKVDANGVLTANPPKIIACYGGNCECDYCALRRKYDALLSTITETGQAGGNVGLPFECSMAELDY